MNADEMRGQINIDLANSCSDRCKSLMATVAGLADGTRDSLEVMSLVLAEVARFVQLAWMTARPMENLDEQDSRFVIDLVESAINDPQFRRRERKAMENMAMIMRQKETGVR